MNLANRSIRLRLTVWYCGVLLAAQIFSGVLIWILFSHTLHADLDNSLVKRTRGLERYLALEVAENAGNLPKEMEEFARSLPADYVMQVKSAEGAVVVISGMPKQQLAKLLPHIPQEGSFGTFQVNNSEHRWFGETVHYTAGTYSVMLAAPLQPVFDALHRLTAILIAVFPCVVTIAAIGGFWISRRALHPVNQMISAATSVSFDNLSIRLPVPKTADEIQRLAETWNAMLQRLESSAMRVTRFTADASHELRTPLSLVRATAELALHRPRTPDRYVEALRVIQGAEMRMTRLVEDLLFLARADNGSGIARESIFDLVGVMFAAISEIAPKAAAKDVGFQMNDNPFCSILGDQDSTQRLIVVLLDNAVKYSPQGGQVSIALDVSDATACLTIRDTGPGISQQAQPHVFERFYRADPSRKAETPSYGLGLAIAHAIAVQQGIELGFESEPGSTTFSARFHVADRTDAKTSTFQADTNEVNADR